MANKTTADGENALRKLGERLREGATNSRAVSEKSLQTVKDGISEQCRQDRQASRDKSLEPEPSKERDRKPPEIDRDR